MLRIFDVKRRTRQHIIADLSINYIERVILQEGHTAQRIYSDYGYDLVMMTFDEEGNAEPGLVFFQLKASDLLDPKRGNYWYDIEIKHFNLWKQESLPVIIVLFDAIKRRAYWVHVQKYFADTTQRPKKGAKTVRVRIPHRQALNKRSIMKFRAMKRPTTIRIAEETEDA